MSDLRSTNHVANPPHAVILLGGESRRMGHDKSGLVLAGQSLLERTQHRLQQQVADITLCVRTKREDLGQFEQITDVVSDDRGGPLLGVLAALRGAHAKTENDFVLTVPVDTPFLPLDLVDRLRDVMDDVGSPAVVAKSGNQIHGLTALYRTDVSALAEQLILGEGERMMRAFHEKIGSAQAVFESSNGDPFFNINEPADLEAAEKRAGAQI